MDYEWTGEIIHWRGPSPFHFVVMPEPAAKELKDEATRLSYGWGCIPVRARVGDTEWTTSLFPREGTYYVPVKDAVRRALGVGLGDEVSIGMDVG